MSDELDRLIGWARSNLVLLVVLAVLLLVALVFVRAVLWAFGFELCIIVLLVIVVILLLSRKM